MALTRDHLDSWEGQHGRIPPGSYVILRTGWADYFEQPDKFLGNFADESRQVFPGEWHSTRACRINTDCCMFSAYEAAAGRLDFISRVA